MFHLLIFIIRFELNDLIYNDEFSRKTKLRTNNFSITHNVPHLKFVCDIR